MKTKCKRLTGKLFAVMFAVLFSLSLIACEPPEHETYDIGRFSYTQFSRDSARVFYPSNINELSNVGATTLTSGMGGTKEGMYWLAEPLAEAGFIVIAVSASNNSTVGGYETAHKSGFGILQAENANRSSPIYGKIGRYGTIGYSKGGGGSINAASDLGSQVHTCVALAPWGPSPTRNHSAATMILTGTSDVIASDSIGERAYSELPAGVPKLYAAMNREGHFYWHNRGSLGSETDFITAWLKYYLEDDETYYNVFSQGPGSGMTNYAFNPADGSEPPGGGCD